MSNGRNHDQEECGADMTGHYRCPVCGYDGLEVPAYSPTTGQGSYEICPSCGYEYGVTDADEGISHEQYRQQWVDDGMPWSGAPIYQQPDKWNPSAQLRAVTDQTDKG